MTQTRYDQIVRMMEAVACCPVVLCITNRPDRSFYTLIFKTGQGDLYAQLYVPTFEWYTSQERAVDWMMSFAWWYNECQQN